MGLLKQGKCRQSHSTANGRLVGMEMVWKATRLARKLSITEKLQKNYTEKAASVCGGTEQSGIV